MSRFRCSPARGALRGTAAVPGDKSIGHRAAIFAALGDGRSVVTGLSGGEDNGRTIEIFRALGVAIEARADGALVVSGRGHAGLRAASAALDCGNSGTTMRLLCGLRSGVPGEHVLAGDQYLHRRPMRRVVAPLRELGARLSGDDGAKPGEIYPPIRISGQARLGGGRHVSDVASAQVKSALLLAGLAADAAVTVVEPGPSRDHSERMLAARGAPLVWGGGTCTLDPVGWDRRLSAMDVAVPGDPSSAAFLAVAATLVPGSDVLLRGVCTNPTRTGFLDALRALGADLTLEGEREVGGEPVADLRVRAASLRGAALSGELVVRAIDEIPILAVAAAVAEGVTTIRDAAELRVKESDRVASTARLLRGLGVEVEELPDGLRITGRARPLVACRADSAGDHRIAMCGAVAALIADGECAIDDADNVRTSFPSFVGTLRALGAELSEESA
jgi:3-phosphoshikimate 1-carboxyvinyltransferase